MKNLSIILAVLGGVCLAAAAWVPAFAWPLVVTAVILLFAAVFVASAVHGDTVRAKKDAAIADFRHANRNTGSHVAMGTPAILIEPHADADAVKTALESEYQGIMRRDY